jgi:plasmid stability protein
LEIEKRGAVIVVCKRGEKRLAQMSRRGSAIDYNACLQSMQATQSRCEGWMTTLTIRNVEPALKERLRIRAARNGRSMEAELRHILSTTVGGESNREVNLAEAIRRRFLPLGGVDLVPHPAVPIGKPPVVDP